MLKQVWISFKEWFWQLVRNCSRIVLEVVSVKTVIWAVITAIYWGNRQGLGLTGFLVVAIGWITVIGFRYAEKYLKMLERVKSLKDN